MDGQTDRRTDRRTDRIGSLSVSRVSIDVLTRDKNTVTKQLQLVLKCQTETDAS